jgi:hypothetical protein
MSDTGLTVPGMTELPRRYDVTITGLAADQPAAVAVALAVVSDALKHPVGWSTG